MKRSSMWAAACFVLMSCTPVVATEREASASQEGHPAGGVQEREISIDDVPEAARETILREAKGHEIVEVEEVRVHGRVFYAAEWIVEGAEVELAVTPDGKIVGAEPEKAEPKDDAGEEAEGADDSGADDAEDDDVEDDDGEDDDVEEEDDDVEDDDEEKSKARGEVGK